MSGIIGKSKARGSGIISTDNAVESVSGSTGVVADSDIDHDSLANFAANEHFTQANITATGTVASGTWEGTDVGVAHGGTGRSSLTADNVILGDGTNSVKFVAPGADGQVLTSTGSTWQSEAVSGGGLPLAGDEGIIDASDPVATVSVGRVNSGGTWVEVAQDLSNLICYLITIYQDNLATGDKAFGCVLWHGITTDTSATQSTSIAIQAASEGGTNNKYNLRNIAQSSGGNRLQIQTEHDQNSGGVTTVKIYQLTQ
jgi:hypothetical protein